MTQNNNDLINYFNYYFSKENGGDSLMPKCEFIGSLDVSFNEDIVPLSKQEIFGYYVSRARTLEQAIKWTHIWDIYLNIFLDDETITHEMFMLRFKRIEAKLLKATKRMYDLCN